MGLLDFIRIPSPRPPPLPPRQSSSPSFSQIPFAKLLANSLRQASRQSSSPGSDRKCAPLNPHSPRVRSPILLRWASSARVRSQVCTTRFPPPGSHRSVHRWTSSARLRSQCALLDLIRQGPSAVCTAGPQPPGSERNVQPLDFNRQKVCQNICQIECQNICQIECQNICQDRMSECTSD